MLKYGRRSLYRFLNSPAINSKGLFKSRRTHRLTIVALKTSLSLANPNRKRSRVIFNENALRLLNKSAMKETADFSRQGISLDKLVNSKFDKISQ